MSFRGQQSERRDRDYMYGESWSEPKSNLTIIQSFLGTEKKKMKITDEFIFALSDVSRDMERLEYELKKEKEQSKRAQDHRFEQDKRIIQAEEEIMILQSKLRSVEEHKGIALSTECDLNRQIENLQKEVESKKHDLFSTNRDIDLVNHQLREKDDRIAQEMRKLKDADTRISQLTKEKKHLQEEVETLRRQKDEEAGRYRSEKMEMITQITTLQNNMDDKQKEVSALVRTTQIAEPEMKKLRDQTEQLKKELQETTRNETKLKHKITCLEEETEQLKRQNGDMIKRFQKDKEEQKSMSTREAEVLQSHIRDFDRKIGEAKEKIAKLTNDNERIQKENEDLKQQKIILEMEDSSSKNSNAELQAKLAALQASSETREQLLRKDVERLTQEHNANIRKQEERHAAEKEEMQAQIEKFFQVLNDEKKVERETLRATIHQVAHTHSITNHILQAAFRTYQGRQQQQQQRWSAANIREMDDDL